MAILCGVSHAGILHRLHEARQLETGPQGTCRDLSSENNSRERRLPEINAMRPRSGPPVAPSPACGAGLACGFRLK
jgi:hypothetical protein